VTARWPLAGAGAMTGHGERACHPHGWQPRPGAVRVGNADPRRSRWDGQAERFYLVRVPPFEIRPAMGRAVARDRLHSASHSGRKRRFRTLETIHTLCDASDLTRPAPGRRANATP
jgi:hypothetical protein